ncbi:MAG: chromate transporter [Leptothrix sp. (in: Bacteria)]|nr:chromate transporter [Leptothrix sp. (in: b-proteobacteria)]
MHDLLLGTQGLSAAGWLAMFTHFMMLSLLAVGGAMTTAPDMQRFVVHERGWLTDAQFTGSVALAQAAPGPNVLFVAVIGFNVGGLSGVLATMAGTLAPSTALAWAATRWGMREHPSRALRAFTTGMAPLTLGLLVATGWILVAPTHPGGATAALVTGTVLFMIHTRLSPMWPIAAGAVAGLAGWV